MDDTTTLPEVMAPTFTKPEETPAASAMDSLNSRLNCSENASSSKAPISSVPKVISEKISTSPGLASKKTGGEGLGGSGEGKEMEGVGKRGA